MSPQTAAIHRLVSTSSVPARTPALLVVDDDRVTRTMVAETLQKYGYDVLTAAGGDEALRILEEQAGHTDAVVLDREMPGMNGMEVVARMKSDTRFAGIPIIMLTGSGEQEQIQEGIDAGVYYYLVKPAEEKLLRSVIDSALHEHLQKRALVAELNRHGAALRIMHACQLSAHTVTEAEDTACFLASCFPDPERVVAGLLELLVNAVEHGNLGVTYDEKTQLLAGNRWREELDRRAALPENQDKIVQIAYQRSNEGYIVRITDAGPGFDWRRYWHIDPARATASHGRGIARARLLAFDRLAYNDAGNQVTVMVQDRPTATSEYAW